MSKWLLKQGYIGKWGEEGTDRALHTALTVLHNALEQRIAKMQQYLDEPVEGDKGVHSQGLRARAEETIKLCKQILDLGYKKEIVEE